MHSLDDILKQAEVNICAASDLKLLDACRVQYLGKKGEITEALKSLGALPIEERKIAGQKINQAKEMIIKLLEDKNQQFKVDLINAQLAQEAIDITLPGRKGEKGSIHPITLTMQELNRIFSSIGFTFMSGPEIEDDYHNFEALNISKNHPARAMQDTFYFADNTLLRTQMSPVQIRAMKTESLPFRMVAMGRVYRRDFDLTHTPMFHQMECLLIDDKTNFAELKGLLKSFLSEFFNSDVKMRLRPSYFPFTEPSAEVDINCLNCKSKGCRICKQTGWLEVLGCGMVHPNVLLNAAQIDSKKYRGFAFGVGIDRLAMLKYGISDLRSLFENDLRFLKQF